MAEYYIHGIRVSLNSDWNRFMQLVALNFGSFSTRSETTQHLDISVSLRYRKWIRPALSVPEPAGFEERWSREVSREGSTARFMTSTLRVEFSEGPPPVVTAHYEIDRKGRMSAWRREVPPWEDVEELSRLAIYLPLFHLFERSGMQVLHAAAAAAHGEALLFTGLNGAGKTTLCYALLDRLGYMSDNFVLWTGSRVLGIPTAMRIPEHGAPPPNASPISFWGKRLVPIEPSRVVLEAKPRALVFMSLSGHTTLAPIPPDEAFRRLEVIHDMTAEFPRYTFLGPLAPPRSGALTKRLVESVPCYALAMADVREARGKVLDLMRSS